MRQQYFGQQQKEIFNLKLFLKINMQKKYLFVYLLALPT
jgi:hypothetical protein